LQNNCINKYFKKGTQPDLTHTRLAPLPLICCILITIVRPAGAEQMWQSSWPGAPHPQIEAKWLPLPPPKPRRLNLSSGLAQISSDWDNLSMKRWIQMREARRWWWHELRECKFRLRYTTSQIGSNRVQYPYFCFKYYLTAVLLLFFLATLRVGHRIDCNNLLKFM